MANSVRASRTRGKVMVEGPLRVGSDVLLSGNGMRGDVTLVKRIAISADGFYAFRLPGCNIIDLTFNTEVATQSCGATVNVGTSASNALLGTLAVSAISSKHLVMVPLQMIAQTSGVTLQASVTALGTAGTQVGSLYVTYVQTGGAD